MQFPRSSKPTEAEKVPSLLEALELMLGLYPAFRSKPIGAPGSSARMEQDAQIAAEDAARAAIAAHKAQAEQWAGSHKAKTQEQTQ